MSCRTPEKKQQELKFPVDWEFRIVVEAAVAEQVRAAVEDCFKKYDLQTKVEAGLQSSSGKYHTWKAPARLENREIMNQLATDLSKIAGIKFLL